MTSKPKSDRIIQLEPDGFTQCKIKPPGGEPELVFHIRWEDVDRIIAYKDDVFAYDIICLGFFLRCDAERYFWVDEEMSGWDELIKFIDERFQIRDWYTSVMYPAFARSERELWKRTDLDATQ